MAGFFGLFKRKGEASKAKPTDSFFLTPDEAKTFGNIEYMRTPRIIKRTFAKTIDGGDIGESIKSISATEEKVVNPNEVGSKRSESFVPSSSFTESNFTPDRKSSTSSDDDIFRKMAKDINKKR